MGIMDELRDFFSQVKEDALDKHLSLLEKIADNIKADAIEEVERATSTEEVKQIHVNFFGKKGRFTELTKFMGKLSNHDKPLLGKIVHEVKGELETALNKKDMELRKSEEQERFAKEMVDITLPGRKRKIGKLHPLTLIEREIKDIFNSLSYTTVEGFEIETDYYNFERLNLPKDHPAREMQDTFYINKEVVLRTHTSPVQARIMDELCPTLPVKVIAPGKVFRRDDDSTHSPMFHQVEGLVIDYGITFTDLKGTLLHFAKKMFGEDMEIRLRPSYFPFTEPGAEVDVSCVNCGGSGCRVCSNTGWLEILGAGMVHPNVLKMAGYDQEGLTGFAFGMGVERIAMLKYGINDLRILFENDIRFLEEF